ncbi:MAG TPA: glucose 1-dehydrogenase [Candidatus Dormibacteraeota bacterium]
MFEHDVQRIPGGSTMIGDHRGRLLEGKVTIVTGASRGIGAAAARAFAAEGASVVLAARSAESLQSIAEEIDARGGQALAVPVDVSEPASVESLVRQTLDAFGRLDGAFNNAADGPPPTPLADLPVEGFDHALAVNLRGTFLCLKYEIPAMLATGGGSIVNMSSTAGLRGVLGLAGYVSSKHGILGLTKVAALDYGKQGIRVNAVTPGPILTDRLAALDESQRERISAFVPVGRLGQPEEVAATVAWLLSDRSTFVTGAAISVDGGRMASGA